MLTSEYYNLPRWNGREKPFYEVYYLKVNDPSLGAALWLRYTFLSPINAKPTASLWAIFFDARRPERNISLKETIPAAMSSFRKGELRVDIGGAILTNSSASGKIVDGDSLGWDIVWEASEDVFRHFPALFYHLPFPRTKVVAPNLRVPCAGYFEVNGVKYSLANMALHQGHVWGRSYSKSWAWANCWLFNEEREAVFEMVAKNGIGVAYLGSSAGDFKFHPRVSYTKEGADFLWSSVTHKVIGKILAQKENIIRLKYDDPMGGERFCDNTKVADSVISIYKRKGLTGWKLVQELTSYQTTAFESVSSGHCEE